MVWSKKKLALTNFLLIADLLQRSEIIFINTKLGFFNKPSFSMFNFKREWGIGNLKSKY